MNIYIWEPVEVSDMQWPCPDGFHVPLQSEWVGVKTILDWLTFSETYWNILRINLKMPYAWNRNPNSSWDVVNSGSRVSYWSSECSSGSWRFIMGTDSDLRMYYDNFSVTASWYSIRPFKNEFVTPVSWWTVINWTLWGAWIFWNQTDWIISITSDWSTGYTIADKNLWATVVYNNWDTLSESNCWYFYQQGNNYWFPWTWSVTTSSTKVNAQNYWPWNYYSSSTFITVWGNWDSSNNTNLRWWVSQQSWTKSVEVQNIYIGEYGWKPWVNTVAYYPLTDNFNDESWNWYNLTNSWWSITTYGWVKCAYYSGSTSVYSQNTSVPVWATRTINCRCYLPASESVDIPVVWTGSWVSYWYRVLALWYWSNGVPSLSDYDVLWVSWWGSKIWQWVNLVWIINWWDMSLYANWVLVASQSRGSAQQNSTVIKIAWRYGWGWSQYFKWYVNEVIVESKARTAQEISDYYNQTKSNYWL